MKKKLWQDLSIRNIVTLVAEIATIISCLLALLLFKDQSGTTSNTTGNIRPVFIAFLVLNLLMFLFLSIKLVRSVFIDTKGKAYRLQKKFKLYQESNSNYLRSLTHEREEELFQKTKKSLKSLDESRTFDEDVYYLILYSLFNDAEGTVNVVSILDDNEWVDTVEEDEFLKVNLALAEKKVHLNRIFVIEEKDVYEKVINNNSIKSFIRADHTYVHLFVVFRDKLARNLLNDIGSGFIEFYNFVVAVDTFSDDEIRGSLVFENSGVDGYNKIYMKLSEFYTPLNQEFVEKYTPKSS